MINTISSASSSTYAPYALAGRPTVGQESGDLKASSFKALEQSAAGGRSENKRAPDDKPAEQGERQRVSGNSAPPVQARDQKDQNESAKKEQIIKEQKQIAELSSRDREVRAHEAAHAAVGGAFAGSPTYEFVRGPDGVSYAVGGEVSIDTSSIPNDPEATIAKARQIKAAANAPADPSSQDRRVGAAAASLEMQAMAELHAKEAAEVQQSAQKNEVKEKEQKAEEAKRAAEDEQHANTTRAKGQADQAAALENSRNARAEIFTKSNQNTVDLTRKLADIGAIKGYSSVGTFLNSRV